MSKSWFKKNRTHVQYLSRNALQCCNGQLARVARLHILTPGAICKTRRVGKRPKIKMGLLASVLRLKTKKTNIPLLQYMYRSGVQYTHMTCTVCIFYNSIKKEEEKKKNYWYRTQCVLCQKTNINNNKFSVQSQVFVSHTHTHTHSPSPP